MTRWAGEKALRTSAAEVWLLPGPGDRFWAGGRWGLEFSENLLVLGGQGPLQEQQGENY